MRRVMVMGSPGSGKSTLARRLGALLNLPVVHLDRLYHRPDWAEPPPGEFEAAVTTAAAGTAWVIDGNYLSTAEVRLRAADTIVYLDMPRWLTMARVIRRATFGLGQQRPDTADGCHERFDPAFLRYVWDWQRDVAPMMRAQLDAFPGRRILLRSTGDVARFVEGVRPPLAAPTIAA